MARRNAGTLDRMITIQRHQVVEVNEFNEEVWDWLDFITVRASRRDVSDGEKFAAGQVGSSLRTRFVIRASADADTVTPMDRVSYDGSVWNIQGVKEADHGDLRGRFIEITAVRSNN